MIRTRFAPSPTGLLHVGSARVALYCWLYARNNNGLNILRIEDTDHERNTEEAVNIIIEGMKWLGLDYDEGPFYQSKRTDRYKEVIDQLLESKQAYRCYCSRERLDTIREELMKAGEKPKYDGKCRDLNENAQDLSKPHVIRFKNPVEGFVEFNDKIRGNIKISNLELDDLIIVRTDGEPTYNLTVVVDDADMKVSMVLRGEDHISNTPRQINILKALGADIPVYAHLPMINGDDGKKLSKRHGAVSILEFKEEGFLPEALLNYLVRLGWSHKDQEIFSVDEMIEYFDLEHISKSPATFNFSKLRWLNQHYMKTMQPDLLAEYVSNRLKKTGFEYNNNPDLSKSCSLMVDRCETINELAEQVKFFYLKEVKYSDAAVAKHIDDNSKAILLDVIEKMKEIQVWNAEHIKPVIKTVVKKHEVKFPKVAQPIRISVKGETESPSIDLVLELLGQNETISKLENFVSFLESK